MDANFYIYKCFFEDEKYIQLRLRKKYLLVLLYNFSDENGYVKKTQQQLGELMNRHRSVVHVDLKYLADNGFIEMKKKRYIRVNRPKNRDRIFMSKEFVSGKYKNLLDGSKFFYIYFSYLQEKNDKTYIMMRGKDIIKFMGVQVKVMQRYYRELGEVGLLEKGRKGAFNTFNFKKIHNEP